MWKTSIKQGSQLAKSDWTVSEFVFQKWTQLGQNKGAERRGYLKQEWQKLTAIRVKDRDPFKSFRAFETGLESTTITESLPRKSSRTWIRLQTCLKFSKQPGMLYINTICIYYCNDDTTIFNNTHRGIHDIIFFRHGVDYHFAKCNNFSRCVTYFISLAQLGHIAAEGAPPSWRKHDPDSESVLDLVRDLEYPCL